MRKRVREGDKVSVCQKFEIREREQISSGGANARLRLGRARSGHSHIDHPRQSRCSEWLRYLGILYTFPVR